MARINLNGAKTSGKLQARKSAKQSHSKKYVKITEEANRRIDEGQRKYANTYQRASTFLAR